MIRPLGKYVLLQIPELALLVVVLLFLQDWTDLSASIFWGVLAVWIIKDAALYPVYRKALSVPEREDSVIGARGVALERLAPAGYIRVRGEYWHARLREGESTLEQGRGVRVVKMKGLTLEVEPEE